ncbi:MAG: cobalamin biosynthesis protein [Clostridiales bacterium]|nr:cobalamin biosynthesis protein [Clostridiales bacterium]
MSYDDTSILWRANRIVGEFLTQYTSFLLPTLVIGYIADLIIGDPHGVWHPVCLIGQMITLFERWMRRAFSCPERDEDRSGDPETAGVIEDDSEDRVGDSDRDGKKYAEFAAGLCMAVLVPACTTALSTVILWVGYRIHWGLGLALQSYMSYTILATKSLRVESMKVYTALRTEGIEAARRAVSMIVGRDTAELDEAEVTRAAVETVAENTSDGVIAPLIFLAVGGPVLGYFYKAVNTIDSMVGYKNERYRHFGTAAARLDDAVNFLPSRIAALLMIAAAGLLSFAERCGSFISGVGNPNAYIYDGERSETTDEARRSIWSDRQGIRNTCRIWRRDRRNHASPNSAQTEAVMAGALGIQLGGAAAYFGVLHEKPTIGDARRPVEAEDIVRANRVMTATSVIGAVVFCGLRLVCEVVFQIVS